jgi:chaperonin GroES
MNIKPLSNCVLIKILDAATVSAGGILIPPTAQEKSQKGEVLAVGPGKTDDKGTKIPVDVTIGDIVLFVRYSGTEITYEDKKCVMLKDSDILAVI